MNSFWDSSSILRSEQSLGELAPSEVKRHSKCRDFLAFLAIAVGNGETQDRGLHPVLTNSSPAFSDVSMGGVSFEVRKTKASTFPLGLADHLFQNREFVVVKQPRVNDAGSLDIDVLDEIAVELQILRHPPLLENENIIDFVSIMYHNAGDSLTPLILPALVVEYAELGNLRSYLSDGLGRNINDKVDMCTDIAKGLHALHRSGAVHGDIKDSNMLVCRHEKRGFIVKVSDFGFAVSLQDEQPRLVGHTKFWEAPEVSSPLIPEYLIQLDIYSYGLLVYTILKNGALYYEAGERADRDDNIRKLKTSGLLAAITQWNLLNTMKSERCLLFIFCKILAYCLQPDPARRFQSLAPVMKLLEFAKPSDLSLSGHENESMYERRRFQSSVYRQSKDRISRIFEDLINSYCDSFEQRLPMVDVLKIMYKQRATVEIDMFLGPGPGSSENHFDFVAAHELCIWRDRLGLMAYPGSPPDEITSPDCAREEKKGTLSFSIQPMPDVSASIATDQGPPADLDEFPLIHELFRKMPVVVQRYTASQLQAISEIESDVDRRAFAFYNSSYCFIEGIGVDVDVDKGLELLNRSAELGFRRSQRLMMKLYSLKKHLTREEKLAFVTWATECGQEADKKALRLLQELDPGSFSGLMTDWMTSRIIRVGSFSGTVPTEAWSRERRHSSARWKYDFVHFGATVGFIGLVERMIESDQLLVNSTNNFGQSPLLIACQSGHLKIALLLLKHGADCSLHDKNDISPLHWLISFSDDEKRSLSQALSGKSIDANCFAQIPSDLPKTTPNIQGGPMITGTPLHWAISCGDIVAVEVLLSLSAVSSSRLGQSRGSAMEMAAGNSEGEILSVLFRDGRTRSAASEYQPFSTLSVRPMFWTLGGISRWNRLMRSGHDFERMTEDTIRLLAEAGDPCNAVLRAGALNMSAPFATAYHQCNADIMRSGLKYGFKPHVNATFGGISSGGTPLALAITHQDRRMFDYLLDAGADVQVRDMYHLGLLQRAAKETDDIYYVRKLLERGVAVDDERPEAPTAFWMATYCGNLRIAKYLWEKGANRDDAHGTNGRTVLGDLIWLKTRNAAERIKFVLSLPDRDGSDGFVAFHLRGITNHISSVLHAAVSTFNDNAPLNEDPEAAEITRLTTSLLLQKYRRPEHVNSTIGPHHDVPLGMAVEIGNHQVMRLLLEAGADPNARDEYARTPLDKLYWRYCYPATTSAFEGVRYDDKLEISKRLTFVNGNTSEILSLLTSYGAKPNVFRFPSWHQEHPGYRDVNWVMERLKEKALAPKEISKTTPVWGGLPITIPERPMQFETQRLLNERHANAQSADDDSTKKPEKNPETKSKDDSGPGE